MIFEELVAAVQVWGEEKNIANPKNAEKQFLKFVEEVFEFKTELDTHLLVNNFTKAIPDKNLKLEMGDILVTLIILSKQLDIDLVECLEMAYNKIKYRKGKTIDGVFVKEEDLENCH